MNSLIESLKQRRKALKLSQRALGEKLGLPQSHISSIESGGTDPRLSTLADMARLLELELVLVPREDLMAVQALIEHRPEDQPRWLPDEPGDDADERTEDD